MKTYPKYVIAALIVLMSYGVWALPPQTATPRAKAVAASRPAPYPSGELTAACKGEADRLKARLDKTFNLIIEPPFVIAGDLPVSQLRAYADGTVARPARAMWASYFHKRPTEPITVLLFTDNGVQRPRGEQEGYAYRSWAKQLFNDTDVSYYGYYRPDRRTMVMNIDTGGGTLVHELTHALIVYDFPDVPDWFNEGLGSLHEQCNVEEDRVVGLENWRLPALQKAIKAGKLRSLDSLLAEDDFRNEESVGMNYAQARYFCMFMQQRGVLKEFYAYYLAHHAGKDAEVLAVEHVFKDKFKNVEKQCLAWEMTLKFPPR